VPHVTRRTVLKAGAALAAGKVATRSGSARRDAQSRLVDAAFEASTTVPARMDDIEHVVILMQENRSFDHFFGTYPGVRGFDDRHVLRQPKRGNRPIWYQYGWAPGDTKANSRHYTLPFHLDTSDPVGDAGCVDSPTHAWTPQHQSRANGAMDQFLVAHVESDGLAVGPQTMGYYTRNDIGFYYDLADAFTICDNYHCSVIACTAPNRLYLMSGTLDPDGHGGGPVTSNPQGLSVPGLNFHDGFPSYTWETMPERLEAAGVSWKAYQPPGSQIYDSIGVLSYNILQYFKSFQDADSSLFAKGMLPSFPGEFQADVLADKLPSVSWIMSMGTLDEHPPASVMMGELAIVQQILSTLLANPKVWEKTLFILTYDENGGFFDHVPPPTAPPGTPGEYLTKTPTCGSNDPAGPIGLGFRVPTLVMSPFSAGGFVCSDVLDHTSTLRFIESRFGVTVPNLSKWRRQTTGDMTGAINFAGGRIGTSQALGELVENAKIVISTKIAQQTLDFVDEDCPVNIYADEVGEGISPKAYPIPKRQKMPKQEPGRARRPSGPVHRGAGK
jgi:phospholipase C